jgi:hypothetical protein
MRLHLTKRLRVVHSLHQRARIRRLRQPRPSAVVTRTALDQRSQHHYAQFGVALLLGARPTAEALYEVPRETPVPGAHLYAAVCQ